MAEIAAVLFPVDLLLRRKRRETGGRLFYVDRDYCIEYELDGVARVYLVPSGYSTDLTSVPLGFRNLASRVDALEASVVHDHAYENRTMRRSVADALFLEIMKASGLGWFKRNLMYGAVRAGGWVVWRRHDEEFQD